jgi:large subunit ribosomal protein L2
MTMRYIGGGHKQKARIIDFKRDKAGVPATVKSIEYDPTRSARIALLYYADGAKTYILAPEGLKAGQVLVSGEDVAPEVGNALPLSKIPVGTIVHNVENKPGKGGSIARSAGSFVQLLAREGKYATLKMPSGEMRNVLVNCMATVGTVSNSDHMNESLGKAGRNRWKGIRPRTRAVAMNPVDHPMGGGEGRASGGHPRSRNGLLSKGKKTRHPKKYSDGLIIAKRKK